MTITIRDIAKAAGVSVATVSRVVGNYGYVSKEKRELILRHIKELNYTPNEIARSMIKKKTNTIGLIIADIHDPFYIDLLDSIEEFANKSGYSILFCNSNESAAKEAMNVRTLIERKVDGMLIVPVLDDVGQEAEKQGSKKKKSLPYQHILDIQRHSIPFVFIDRYLTDVDSSAVMLDNINTTFKAMSKLIEHGYRDIQIVVGSGNSSSSKERIQGVIKACESNAYRLPEENWIKCDFSPKHVYETVKKAISQKQGDAIFTLDNNMTIGTLKALIEAGLAVNKDVYMLGFDDIHLYNLLMPEKIGVIHQPVHSICKYAVEMLLEKIEAPNAQKPRIIRLEGEIQL